MENKLNDPRPQNPNGEGSINVPLVELYLPMLIEQLKNGATWTDRDRHSVTLLKSATMSIVLIGLHRNTVIKPHTAKGDISIQVLEGKIVFTAEQQNIPMEQGQIIALPANILHSVKALTESFFLLTLAI